MVNTATIGILFALLIISLGFGVSYAEEITVDSAAQLTSFSSIAKTATPLSLDDFMSNLNNTVTFDIQSVGCERFEDGVAPLIQCYLEGFPYFIEMPEPEEIDTNVFECEEFGVVYDPDTQTCMTPENLEKAAIEKETRKQFFPDYPMSQKDQQIFILESYPELTDEQFQRLQDLKKISDCTNDTYVSQTPETFEVRRGLDGELIIDNSISNKKHNFNSPQTVIDAGIQECLHQPLTKKSVQYDNIWDAQGLNLSHTERAAKVPIMTQEMMLQNANFGIPQPKSIDELLCNALSSKLHRDSIGCPEDFDMDFPMPAQKPFINEHPLLADVQNWKDGDMSEQLKKIHEKALQEARQATLNQVQR